MTRSITGGWRAAILGVALAFGPPSTATSQGVGLPETRAGRVARDWLRSVGQADSVALAEWIRAHDGDGNVETRVRRMLGLARETGGLDVTSVHVRGEDLIRLAVRSRKTGAQYQLTMGVDSRGRVEEFALSPGEDAGAPAAAAAEGELPTAIQRLVRQHVSTGGFSGVVLVARDTTPVAIEVHGVASREYRVANTVDTRFNLGSITKVLTSIAIGQLVASGRLSYDDTLGRYLPAYPNRTARERVTIRHLLEMRSGIGDFFGARYEVTPRDRIRTIADYLTLFADDSLQFEPGSSQAYSNGGYVVLGAIIERVSGMTYYDYLARHVYAPAGMTRSASFESDGGDTDVAMGYTREAVAGDTVLRPNVLTRPGRGSSAGGSYSTARDMLRLSLALQRGVLRLPAFGAVRQVGERFPGLGVAGGSSGMNAVFDVDARTRTTLIVLSNLDPPAAERLARALRPLLGIED